MEAAAPSPPGVGGQPPLPPRCCGHCAGAPRCDASAGGSRVFVYAFREFSNNGASPAGSEVRADLKTAHIAARYSLANNGQMFCIFGLTQRSVEAARERGDRAPANEQRRNNFARRHIVRRVYNPWPQIQVDRTDYEQRSVR